MYFSDHHVPGSSATADFCLHRQSRVWRGNRVSACRFQVNFMQWARIFKLIFFCLFLLSDLKLLIVLGYWVSLKWLVHRAPVRPDIVSLIHHEVAKNRRQPYCVSEPAGHQVCFCSSKKIVSKALLIWRMLFKTNSLNDLSLDKCRVLGNRTRCSENPSSQGRRHSQVWGFAACSPMTTCYDEKTVVDSWS